MVKKLKAMAEKSGSESQLRAAVKDSAQEIWLAGLGAFSKAQEEGQKVFKALVREGTSIQKRTMKVTEDKVNDVTAKVTKVAAGLQKQGNRRPHQARRGADPQRRHADQDASGQGAGQARPQGGLSLRPRGAASARGTAASARAGACPAAAPAR